jgi:hypothetical protein
MADEITGRGFWDVVDNHMFELSVVAIIGFWSIRRMWQDWCVTRSTRDIAVAKLKTKPDEPKDEDREESETF